MMRDVVCLLHKQLFGLHRPVCIFTKRARLRGKICLRSLASVVAPCMEAGCPV